MSHCKIEGGRDSLYEDEEWNKIKSSIVKQYIESEEVNKVTDQLLIQEQNELM